MSTAVSMIKNGYYKFIFFDRIITKMAIRIFTYVTLWVKRLLFLEYAYLAFVIFVDVIYHMTGVLK